MKRIMLVLATVGLVGAVAAVSAHDGHKQAKAPAAAPIQAKAKSPAVTPIRARPIAAMKVETVRLRGELIDPQCWFTHNGEGEKHAECAVRCARGGQDLAFLDAQTGELYTLIATSHGENPNVGLYENVGVPVSVRGTAYQRGNNRGLLVEAVEKVRTP